MFLANRAQAFTSFEKYGNWVDALQNQVSYNMYAPFKAGSREPLVTNEYAERINKQHMQVYKEAEAYMSFVKFTEDQNVINQKLADVRLRWFTQFFVGQKDVDADWDTFVREYKATGADQIVKAYAGHVEKAKEMWAEVAD